MRRNCMSGIVICTCKELRLQRIAGRAAWVCRRLARQWRKVERRFDCVCLGRTTLPLRADPVRMRRLHVS